jgi:endonuclease/exonuclease/phosphatase family metal-dependent hydrolase
LKSFRIASPNEAWQKGVRVRVATFNIKHAELRGIGAVADVIRASRAQIVGLQEVDVGCKRSGCMDEAVELARLLEMAACFAPAMPYEDGWYGTALLTSLAPSLDCSVVPLPGGSAPGEEPRVLLASKIAGLRVYVAHLDLPTALRLQQAEAIAREIGDCRSAVVLADMNEPPDGAAVRRLVEAGFRDAWAEARADEKVTAPSDRPQARIDQVLLGRDLPRPVSAEAIATGASDHALVVVEI